MARKTVKKNVKIPKLGGGGPPLGNFPHIILFFSDHVPNKFAVFCCDLKLVTKNAFLQAPSRLEIWLQAPGGILQPGGSMLTVKLNNKVGGVGPY